jgi:hypothetical protein
MLQPKLDLRIATVEITLEFTDKPNLVFTKQLLVADVEWAVDQFKDVNKATNATYKTLSVKEMS